MSLRRLARLGPRTLSGQLMLLLLAALLVAQLLAGWIFADERRGAIDVARREQIVDQLGPVVRLLLAADPTERQRVIDAFNGPLLRLSLDSESAITGMPRRRMGRLADRLEQAIGAPVAEIRIDLDGLRGPVWRHPEEGEPSHLLLVSTALPDGVWLNARFALRPPGVGIALSYLTVLALSALAIGLAALVTARRITRPLRLLAEAAERLGRGETIPALPETGPLELRAATRTFNRMQDRIQRFVGDRLRMLAAVGHDLRTPITTLTLRAELLEDSETRSRMLETLADMQHMVEGTLAFARDEAETEPARPVDLRALVDSIVDDLADLGQPVELRHGLPVPVIGRPSALRRALRNLLDNAVRYGGGAVVRVEAGPDEAVVTIDDSGPGIPEDRLEAMFEPFVRLDSSRSAATGGAGLGLAIARGVARHHGGEASLANRPEGGVRATLRLPASGISSTRR